MKGILSMHERPYKRSAVMEHMSVAEDGQYHCKYCHTRVHSSAQASGKLDQQTQMSAAHLLQGVCITEMEKFRLFPIACTISSPSQPARLPKIPQVGNRLGFEETRLSST